MPVAILLVAGTAAMVHAASLKPETIESWDNHVDIVDADLQARLDGTKPFLWVDEEPSRAERVRAGEILVTHMGRSGSHPVPHGLIHDWSGAIFIPGACMDDVLAVLHDYGRYKDFYKPAVITSKPLDQTGADYRFTMLWMQKVLFVTAAVDSTYESSYFHAGDKRGYSVTRSTRMQEIQNYGQPEATELPPDQGRGFLWRMYSVIRYQERDGGVYLEVEALGLSRDIPVSLRWMVSPVVDRLSRDSLVTSLRETRDAIRSNRPAFSTLAARE
ncbi:MAG TPA: hypothetical protein VMB25_05795 [Bryobacteraceae bacterium]|nr:hypothetical protein [Bryobacteraceae bacterium]